MKKSKIANYYDKIYSEDKNVFSGEPLPLVKRLLEYKTGGSVLEIGAGGGRNSLFLAKNGFRVTALDISSEAIKIIQKQSKKENLIIETKIVDIATSEFTKNYDVVICAFMLHHLKINDALALIEKMQKHTALNGFNLITAFTKNGDFYKNNPATPNFYLDDKTQLENLYSEWKIKRSFEKAGKARVAGIDGKPQFNTFVGLLAKKVKDEN